MNENEILHPTLKNFAKEAFERTACKTIANQEPKTKIQLNKWYLFPSQGFHVCCSCLVCMVQTRAHAHTHRVNNCVCFSSIFSAPRYLFALFAASPGFQIILAAFLSFVFPIYLYLHPLPHKLGQNLRNGCKKGQ